MKDFDKKQDLTTDEIAIVNIFSTVRHFYPALANISDNTDAGLLLSHLNYWCRQKGQGFYRKDKLLMSDTTLTLNKLKAARTILRQKEFIIVSREGMPAHNHYYINYKNIIDAYKELSKTTQIDENQLSGKITTQIDENQLTRSSKIIDQVSYKSSNQNGHKPSTKKTSKVIRESNKESKEKAASALFNEMESIMKHEGIDFKGKELSIDIVDEDGFHLKLSKADKDKAEMESLPERWNSHHFRKYLAAKYESAYGHESLEYIHKEQGDGKIIGRIKKQLIEKFSRDFKLNNIHLKEYIEWVFGSDDGNTIGKCIQIKSRGSTVNFSFLAGDNLISEWWSQRDGDVFESTPEEDEKTKSIIKSRMVS